MTSPNPKAPWPSEYKLDMARKLLVEGKSLAEAAQAVEMTKSALDRALWNTLGSAIR